MRERERAREVLLLKAEVRKALRPLVSERRRVRRDVRPVGGRGRGAYEMLACAEGNRVKGGRSEGRWEVGTLTNEGVVVPWRMSEGIEWRGECAMSGVVPWSKRKANEEGVLGERDVGRVGGCEGKVAPWQMSEGRTGQWEGGEL